MLLELTSVSISSSSNKVLDTVPSTAALEPSPPSDSGGDSDPLSCLLAVIGVSNTMSVQGARRRFLRLEDDLDRGAGTDGSFPGCLSAQTRRRSGTQLVKEESRL